MGKGARGVIARRPKAVVRKEWGCFLRPLEVGW